MIKAYNLGVQVISSSCPIFPRCLCADFGRSSRLNEYSFRALLLSAMSQRKMQMLRVSRESVKRNPDGLMRSEGLVICIRSSDHIQLPTFQSLSCKLSSTCNLASPPTHPPKPRLCSILQVSSLCELKTRRKRVACFVQEMGSGCY